MTLEEAVQKLEEAVKQLELLREENKRLRRELEEWKRGHRTRKQRFSSGAEGRSDKPPKKPGQKKGHAGAFRPVPERIDAVVEHPTPACCTACGGDVQLTDGVERIVIEDIPVVQPINTAHTTRIGRCARCGVHVRAKLPGSARTQLGPNATALIIALRYQYRMPLRLISELLETSYRLKVTPGGIIQHLSRHAERTSHACKEIHQHIQTSDVVGADETGASENGRRAWAWLLRTEKASLFKLKLSRAARVFDRLIRKGFAGVLASDCYGVYTRRVDVIHSYCGAHIIRKAKRIAEVSPHKVNQEFADKLVALYKKGSTAKDFETKQRVRNTFQWLIHERRFKRRPELRPLRELIQKYFEGFVAFLGRDDIPWNNNATERDLRPLCIIRKISRTTRSRRGSKTLAHWLSITQTLRKNGIPLAHWVRLALLAHRETQPLPSVFS